LVSQFSFLWSNFLFVLFDVTDNLFSKILISLDSISPVLNNLIGLGEINASWMAWFWGIVVDVINVESNSVFISLVHLFSLGIPFSGFPSKSLSCWLSVLRILINISKYIVNKINFCFSSSVDFINNSVPFGSLGIGNKSFWLTFNLSSNWGLDLSDNIFDTVDISFVLCFPVSSN